MGSDSVTCHPTEVASSCPYPTNAGTRLFSYLAGYISRWYTRRRSPIQVLTGPDVGYLRSCDECHEPLCHATKVKRMFNLQPQNDRTVVTLPLTGGVTLLSSGVTDLRRRFFGGNATETVSSLFDSSLLSWRLYTNTIIRFITSPRMQRVLVQFRPSKVCKHRWQ